jgi:hypothetical protein
MKFCIVNNRSVGRASWCRRLMDLNMLIPFHVLMKVGV